MVSFRVFLLAGCALISCRAFSIQSDAKTSLSSETRLWARREPIRMPSQTPMVPYKVGLHVIWLLALAASTRNCTATSASNRNLLAFPTVELNRLDVYSLVNFFPRTS